MSDHPASRTNFYPDFRSVDVPAPSFKTEMPHVEGPSPPPPPTPAPYRDVSTGLTQTAVSSMIEDAKARGDQVYLAKLVKAAVADGFSVPDELTDATARIVPPKMPTDSASYQAPAEPGSHWSLKQHEVEALVADMRKFGVSQEKIDAALAADGYVVENLSRNGMSDEELEWAASNGLPRNAKSYDLNFAELGQGVQHLTPQQFRDMKANMEVTFWGWKIPESVAPSLLSDIVRGGSAWRAAQGNPQAETQYIADQRRILAAAVGADKVDWAIRDAEHWRAELKTKNPAFERVLNDFGAFTSARVVAQLYQHTGRLAEFSNLTEKRKGAKR